MTGRRPRPTTIAAWVEKRDPAFAAALCSLRLGSVLDPPRGSGGVTLVLPTEKVRAEIVEELRNGVDGEERALQILDAHILLRRVARLSELRGAPTRLGGRLRVTGTCGAEAHLTGGARVRPAEDFHHASRRDAAAAAWEVLAGELSCTESAGAGGGAELGGELYRAPRRRGSGSPAVVAPARPSPGGASVAARQELAQAAECRFAAYLRGENPRDPYLDLVAGLLAWLYDREPETYAAVTPLVDRDPATTFYLLLEPYKAPSEAAPHLLQGGLLFGSGQWNGSERLPLGEGSVTQLERAFESGRTGSRGPAPLIHRGPGTVRAEIDRLRMEKLVGPDGHKSDLRTPARVHAVYKALAASNTIGGAGPVFPAATLELLGADPARKLWQDQLRLELHAAFEELRNAPRYCPQDFGALLRKLRLTSPGTDYAAEATYADPRLLRDCVDGSAQIDHLLRFINSTDFLYTPVAADQVGEGWGEIPTVGRERALHDAKDLSVYNAEACKAARLAKLRDQGLDAPQALEEGAIAQLRRYVERHGAFPPELEAEGLQLWRPAGAPGAASANEAVEAEETRK